MQRTLGDPLPQKRAGRLVMRFFSSCTLVVAVLAGLLASGSLALAWATPAGASLAGITVNCGAGDSLVDAIYNAAPGSTLLLSGTCIGNFYIDKSLTLSGPATLDGGGGPNQFGSTLNVAAGTVVLNNLVIQDGVGIDNIGGGIWNSGQLTLNHSAVTHNAAGVASGIFNQGELTLNSSTVSNNTATGGTGGIFNCGGNAGFESFGLCTASTSLTLNNSTVSNNVGGNFGQGGGIDNDLQGTLTLIGSTVSGNTTSGNGAGIDNNGSATINNSNVSGNTTSGGYGNGGGIENDGTATLSSSNVSGNATGSTYGNGGGIENTGTATLIGSTVSGNTASANGGGIENDGTATFNGVIVSGNTAGSGGGIMDNGTATINKSVISNNSSTGPSEFFGNGGGLSLSSTGSATLNNSTVEDNSAVFVGGGIFAGGPVRINNNIVTGNTAGGTGGGMLVWNGLTAVANSAFSNNTDMGVPAPDTLPGVSVAPANYFGLGNNPTFTTTHSTYI